MSKNKLNKEQIWQLVFTILPFALIRNLGSAFATDEQMSILYNILFGGLGALLGWLIFQPVKSKSTLVKSVSLATVVTVLAITLKIMSSKPSDKEIAATNWIHQKLGNISFESPTELTLQKLENPNVASEFLKSSKVYTDGDNERMTLFHNAIFTSDTFSIINIFSSSVERMLTNIGVSEIKQMDDILADDEEIYAKFEYEVNNEEVIGFGYMIKNGSQFQSIWLIPTKRAFSSEYIDRFENAIEPD